MCRAPKCIFLMFIGVIAIIGGGFVFKSTAALASDPGSSQYPPQRVKWFVRNWVSAGDLTEGRHGHTATKLSDGRVLIVGGLQERVSGSPGLAITEIYDPIRRTWSETGSLTIGRTEHTATSLADGKVLVAGGKDSYDGSVLTSVEIYNPINGNWSSAPSLSVPRRGHSATLLADGRVLIAGGRYSTDNPDVHASAEIFDPASGTWSSTDPLLTPREGHSATRLLDGRVLIVNGYYQSWLATAEIFDPASEAWSQVPTPLFCHGVAHTATLMPDGKVLVVGGACGSGIPGIQEDAEIYDPRTSTWTAIAPLPAGREAHTATLVRYGRVLVVGGDNGDVPQYDSALIYVLKRDVWTPTGSLITGRRSHTATLLNNGRVLVVGGWGDDTTFLQSAELWGAPRLFWRHWFQH